MSDGVSGGVVSEFHHGKKLGPFLRFIRGEQPQVCFQFLVYPFRFPVSLRVVGSGEGNVISEEAGEFSCEG